MKMRIIFLLTIIFIIFIFNSCFMHREDLNLIKFIHALYIGDEQFIKKHSDFKLNEIEWRAETTKQFYIYLDTGPVDIDYWVKFSNGLIIFLNYFENMNETREDGTNKYWDWKISRMYAQHIDFPGKGTIFVDLDKIKVH